MNRFIEVVGAGGYTEGVVQYRAYGTVEVNDPRMEIAMREATALLAQCIGRLRESGITDQELREGGPELVPPEQDKQAGHEARQRFLVSCDESQRLMRGLASLDSLFEDPRYRLKIAMGNHLFRAAAVAKRGAERAAFAEAEAKARNLASAAGLKLLAPLELEELDGSTPCSGGLGERGGAGGNHHEALFAATRSVTVRLRVRFLTEPEN